MTKIKEETFGLISAALVLGFANPDELLWLVATEAKPLGRLPYIPNHGNPKLIRFTMKQVQFIKRKLKNYKPEPLDFEKIGKLLQNGGLSAEKLGSSTPAGGPLYKELLDETT